MPPMISSAMSGWPNSPACCPSCAIATPICPFPATDEALGHNRLFEAMARLIQLWAARRPLVLLLDDMQWADTATLDLIALPRTEPRRTTRTGPASAQPAYWSRYVSRPPALMVDCAQTDAHFADHT